MRILLADDEPGVRSALRLLLSEQEGISVVGETSSAVHLADLVDALCPDVLLVDWELPGFESLVSTLNRKRRVVDLVRQTCRNVAVVAMSGRPEARGDALHVGVDAFVSKGDPPDVLLGTLATACDTSAAE